MVDSIVKSIYKCGKVITEFMEIRGFFTPNDLSQDQNSYQPWFYQFWELDSSSRNERN